MIIGVDLGNKNTKTKRDVFVSGVKLYGVKPPLATDIIKYNDRYFSLSDQRINYTRQKIDDENFLILLLMAISREIKRQGLKKSTFDIELALGLPPDHYGSQAKQLIDYYENQIKTISFEYNDKLMTFRFKKAACFVQGHAAMMVHQKLLKSQESVLSHDIGGITWEIILFEDDPDHPGEKRITKFVTLEHGIIYLYRNIISYINSEYSLKFTEDMIDKILKGGRIPGIGEKNQDNVRSVIKLMTQEYLETGIKMMGEYGIDPRLYYNAFLGGSSITLSKDIEEIYNLGLIDTYEILNDIGANAEGYELLYKKMYKRG